MRRAAPRSIMPRLKVWGRYPLDQFAIMRPIGP
jgi:hypothetical protein